MTNISLSRMFDAAENVGVEHGRGLKVFEIPPKSGVMRLFDALPSFAKAAEGILRALRLTASLLLLRKKIYG